MIVFLSQRQYTIKPRIYEGHTSLMMKMWAYWNRLQPTRAGSETSQIAPNMAVPILRQLRRSLRRLVPEKITNSSTDRRIGSFSQTGRHGLIELQWW